MNMNVPPSNVNNTPKQYIYVSPYEKVEIQPKPVEVYKKPPLPTNNIVKKGLRKTVDAGKKVYNNKIGKRLMKEGFGFAARTASMFVGFILMMSIRGNFANQNRTPVQSNGNVTTEMIYEAGKQHVRDSLRIAELEQKLAVDSMKISHSIDPAALAKVAKKIK